MRARENTGARILVTGGLGFIGHNVCRIAKEKGHPLQSVDNFNLYGHYNPTVHLPKMQRRYELLGNEGNWDADLRDPSQVAPAFESFAPDVVVHLASFPIATIAKDNPKLAIEEIISATMNVLEACAKHSVRRIVLISSSMVYGHFKTQVVKEDHPLDPVELYGTFKVATENMVKYYSRAHDIEYNIVRPSAVYGPLGNEAFVITKFVTAAQAGEPITVHDPSTRLDFSFVRDTARGIYLAATSAVHEEAFNITAGRSRSLGEVVSILKEHFPSLEVIETQRDALYPKRGTLDISKARELLGYEPEYDLERGLEETIHGSRSTDERQVLRAL